MCRVTEFITKDNRYLTNFALPFLRKDLNLNMILIEIRFRGNRFWNLDHLRIELFFKSKKINGVQVYDFDELTNQIPTLYRCENDD